MEDRIDERDRISVWKTARSHEKEGPNTEGEYRYPRRNETGRLFHMTGAA